MCISNVTKIKNIQNIQVMANQNKTDIGLIGLAVMGENLALNMESKGWHVSVYNRTVPGVEEGVVERFLRSFLFYVPYVTLAVMTFPSIVNATSSPIAGLAALVLGIAAAWLGANLLQVAVGCCAVVLVLEFFLI